MTQDDKPINSYFVVFALAADVVGILGFVGFKPSRGVGLALVALLALSGLIIATIALVSAVRLWYSPRGSYYTAGFHKRRIGGGLIAVLLATGLGAFLVFSTPTQEKPNIPTPSNSPSRTSD